MIVNNVIATGNETQQSTMLYKQNGAAQHAVGLCFLLFKFTFVRRQLLNVNDFSVLVRQEACLYRAFSVIQQFAQCCNLADKILYHEVVSFWELRPQTTCGTSPLDTSGGLAFPDPQLLSPGQ